MKKFRFAQLIFTFLIFSVSFAVAQVNDLATSQNNNRNAASQTATTTAERPNLLLELNLSPVQLRQIRRLNQERRPQTQQAQARLQAANRALDQAIYADSDNEAEVQSLIKEVHDAQLDVIQNRVGTERAIRRILTPQQLARFRELRGQFMANRPALNNRQQQLKNIPRVMRQTSPAAVASPKSNRTQR